MDNSETISQDTPPLTYHYLLNVTEITQALEGQRGDELSIIVHLLEDHLCYIADLKREEVVQTGWLPKVDYMDFYIEESTGLFPPNERYLLELIKTPERYGNTNTREHLLSMTIWELHNFVRTHQLNRDVRIALEAVWGTQRSAIALEPHRLGPQFVLGDDVSVRETILSLSDYHFIRFCNLPMKSGFIEFLRRQPYFIKKLRRIRQRYELYREIGLVVHEKDLFDAFS